jgi:hypothetical protein
LCLLLEIALGSGDVMYYCILLSILPSSTTVTPVSFPGTVRYIVHRHPCYEDEADSTSFVPAGVAAALLLPLLRPSDAADLRRRRLLMAASIRLKFGSDGNNDGFLDAARPNDQEVSQARRGTCTLTANGSLRSTRATPKRLLRREAATVGAARCCVESFLPTKTTRPPPTMTMAEVQPRRNKPPPPTDRPTASLAAMLLSPPPTRAAAGRRSARRTVLEDYNEDNATIQRPDGCSKPFCAYGTSLARIDRFLPWP